MPDTTPASIDTDLRIIREDMEARAAWTVQAESGVVPPYSVEELIVAAQIEMQGDERRPEEERGLFPAAVRVIAEREQTLHNMVSYPLTHGFVPDDLWLILRELCRKRVAMPGRVLVLWLSGGIRAGKSHALGWLSAAHWQYYRVQRVGSLRKGAHIFAMVGTKIEQSPQLQQRPMISFMPIEAIGGDKGSVKGTREEKLKISGGRFTDDRFLKYQQVRIETGEQFESGGECKFWAETQVEGENVHMMQGIEATMAWLDEGKNPSVLKSVRERVASKAVRTNEPWHKELMFALLKKLEKHGTPEWQRPTPYELGSLMLGCVVNTYTPRDGWNTMVSELQSGAEFPDRYKRNAPELVGKPGVLDPRVPVLAFPKDETCLIGYLHTSTNKAVDVYTGLSADMRSSSEAEIRKLLYGYVENNTDRVFHCFGSKHLCDWADIARDGTVYEVIDFGAVKPPSIMWVIADKLGRLWQAQEWPCESVPIEIDGRDILPGPWAVTSATGRFNGDEGPAYKLRLDWNAARIVMEIWRMRRRLMDKLAETGAPFTGSIRTEALSWKTGLPGQSATLDGPFALPHMVIPDPRGVMAALNGSRVGDAYQQCENGITFDTWDGYGITAPSDYDGQREILEKLKATAHGGEPLVRINRECTNTIFMFNTYTVPPHKDGPQRKDEACVEWFDLWKYLLRWEPEYVDLRSGTITGGGSF